MHTPSSDEEEKQKKNKKKHGRIISDFMQVFQ